MKLIFSFTLLLAVAGGSLRADFKSLFEDSKLGTTVTSNGVIEVNVHPGREMVYFVGFRTDTGSEKIVAQIPAELLRQDFAGKPAKITATIHEHEDPKTKKKIRFLEVLKIEVPK